ncbi:transmembrane protein 271-like [Dunckerocampus dactyliophorus]|uniref:transmembrane protein 271-like n=1 Tax=Dunckerocampus dactyliophorus TaxID=161453 RepID=UPI0024056870|nr:transmembrane protein 271-like [Dunckerocampus dactyliophorus]
MKVSGKGLCVVLSSSLLFVCALSELALGLRCVSLGSSVKEHFHLGAAAGAFYSGMLLGSGQVLLGVALLCCTGKPRSRNLVLLGVVVFLLGVLAAFSGAVVDGDTASLVERKYTHYCFHPGLLSSACEQLREYHRSLVISTVLSTLECLLGLLNLLLIQRYKAAQFSRSRPGQRHSSGPIIFSEERDCSSADFQPVSYINLAVLNVFDETGAEVQRGGHPSIELPGYSPADPEINRCFPFSYPLPSDLPPAYEDIFPAEVCNT